MDFHDFTRFLGKSGVYLIHPLDMCRLSVNGADPSFIALCVRLQSRKFEVLVGRLSNII